VAATHTLTEPSSPSPHEGRDLTACTICGTQLRRVWTPSGTDWHWRDKLGRTFGGDLPTGFTDGYAWLNHLADLMQRGQASLAMVNTYSVTLATVSGGGRWPWEHAHQDAPLPPYDGHFPEDHCDQPMRLTRDAWVCRGCSHSLPL
jgi:hypothetical protein